MEVCVAAIVLCAAHNALAGDLPTEIILKNGSAFDIMYKKMPSYDVVYKDGKEIIYEEQIIKAGEGIRIPVRFKFHDGNPEMQLAIKRYGYGSSLSPWVTVPNPADLAKDQLDKFKNRDYIIYTQEQGRLPIITVKTGYTGGWNFVIGHMK